MVEYELLVKHPAETVDLIYQFTGQDKFKHDFNNVEYQAEDFDTLMHTKDLHTVRKKVEWKPRATVLPPDLFTQIEGLQFWNENHQTRANRITMQSSGNKSPSKSD